MAKYLGETKSGSEAGTTYSRNSYGQYSRRKAIPVNPNTLNQRKVRGYFANATQTWRTLSAEEQGMWASWAQLHPVKDALGNSIILKGNVAFIGQAVKALTNGQAIPRTPPADAVSLDPVQWTFAVAANAGTTLNGVSVSYTATSSATTEEIARAAQEGRALSVWASTPRQSESDFVAQRAMIKLGLATYDASAKKFTLAVKDSTIDSRLTGAATQFTRIEIRDETAGLVKTVTLDAVVQACPFTIPTA